LRFSSQKQISAGDTVFYHAVPNKSKQPHGWIAIDNSVYKYVNDEKQELKTLPGQQEEKVMQVAQREQSKKNSNVMTNKMTSGPLELSFPVFISSKSKVNLVAPPANRSPQHQLLPVTSSRSETLLEPYILSPVYNANKQFYAFGKMQKVILNQY
jgi:hypothetical protein